MVLRVPVANSLSLSLRVALKGSLMGDGSPLALRKCVQYLIRKSGAPLAKMYLPSFSLERVDMVLVYEEKGKILMMLLPLSRISR